MRNLKYSRSLAPSTVGLLTSLSLIFSMFFLYSGTASAAGSPLTTIKGSAAPWTLGAHLVGHHSTGDQVTIGLMLRTSNPAEQQSLMASLYNKNSPNYHHWLSTGEFMARFAPASSDVVAAESFLTHTGLHLLASPDATLLLASGTVGQVEAAFHTTINDYRLTDGHIYYSNTTDVQIPTSLSHAVLGVFGLSSMSPMRSLAVTDYTPGQGTPPPPPYGGGPFGSGLTPSQIAGIYDSSRVYSNLHDTGQGVTLAVFELAGYRAGDITFYEKHYHLRHVPLVNKPVLGGVTTDNGASEVELDIEFQIAMAPGARKLLVYESPNTELGALAQYLQIAKDNQADSISTSWGNPCEYFVDSQITLAENQIFLQMASQGQSLFNAAGDSGAFGCTALGITLPLPPGPADRRFKRSTLHHGCWRDLLQKAR